MVPAENTESNRVSAGERYARIYEINMARCIFCGYCEIACPFDAITLGNDFELSELSRDALVYTKEMLLEPPLRRTPAQDPELSVAEIARKAANKRFVQILLPVAAEMMYGKKYYWPIYEIAQQYDLPIGLHAGSMYRHATTANGWPSHYLHDYVAQSQVFEDQLLSLVSEGVFEKFPKLRIVLIESGVTWVPAFLWRMSKFWRGLRTEIPWLDRSPLEIFRDHFRLTVQPFDAPESPDIVRRIIDHLGSDELLLFSSDYPHWQFDGDNFLPVGIPDDLARKIMVDNPHSIYFSR